MEALISSMMASGLSLKRPPHILLLICDPPLCDPPRFPMTAPQHPEKPRGFKRLVVLATGILAGLATGVAGVYGIGLLLGNRVSDTPCWPAVETARRVAPFAHGEVAAVAAATKALLVPDLTFR